MKKCFYFNRQCLLFIERQILPVKPKPVVTHRPNTIYTLPKKRLAERVASVSTIPEIIKVNKQFREQHVPLSTPKITNVNLRYNKNESNLEGQLFLCHKWMKP